MPALSVLVAIVPPVVITTMRAGLGTGWITGSVTVEIVPHGLFGMMGE